MIIDSSSVSRDLVLFTESGLLKDHEVAQVLELLSSDFPFTEAMAIAESVHVHVTVEDISILRDEDAVANAAAITTGNAAERKFGFASGLNVVFASQPTAQDELIPGAETRPKPYVDHLGVDLREVNETTETVFARIPDVAQSSNWRHVYQNGPVRCCHVEMGPKHWVYPPEGAVGGRRPIEFAFGDLRPSAEYLGCDYRPIDPAHPLAAMADEAGNPGPVATALNARPRKVHVFEECSCNTSSSRTLLDFLRNRYGDEVDIRSFDLAKPEGLLPLPPPLFMELQSKGFGILPALVVDGAVRTQGWLPNVHDAVRLIEEPEESQLPLQRPAKGSAECCGTDGFCC